ncbi:MAG: anti-sigma factor family protein [Telluria sp.]
MKFSDETLMAYADGELDELTRSAVERAIRSDPSLAAKVRQHTALRTDVFAAFSSVMDEPVPQRLAKAAKPGKVIQLNTARAARAAEASPQQRRWSWPEWGAIAATLMVGVLAGGAGVMGLQQISPVTTQGGAGGALVAQGHLAEALSHQLAGAAGPVAGVKIGVSFESKDGGYCRSFLMGSAAGLACRNGAEWKLPMLAEAAPAAGGQYRQAAAEMPPMVLDAIDARITGRTLDAKAEEAARARGWKK